MGWNWIGIITSDDDYGQLGSKNLRRDLFLVGGCIDFIETVPKSSSKSKYLKIIEVVKRSTVNVIVIYVSKKTLVPVMEEFAMNNITGKVWIISDPCTVSQEVFKREMLETINGTIGLAHHTTEIVGFLNFLYEMHPSRSPDDIFTRLFWEKAFSCKWGNNNGSIIIQQSVKSTEIRVCTGDEKVKELDASLFDIYTFVLISRTYNAAYAIMNALYNLYSCQNLSGPFSNGSCANLSDLKSWQFLHYVKSVKFKTKAGEEVFFDMNGDPPVVFDILNQHISSNGTLKCLKVGNVDSRFPAGKETVINDNAIKWNGAFSGEELMSEINRLQNDIYDNYSPAVLGDKMDTLYENIQNYEKRLQVTKVPRSVCSESCSPGFRKSARKGQPVCCFDCIVCSEGEFTNHTDSSVCMKCPEDQWSNSVHNKCVPRIIEFLSYSDPLGIAITVVSIFCSSVTVSILYLFIKYRETPIVRANNRALSYFLLFSIMLCFLCALIFIGSPVTATCMLRQVIFSIVFSFCIACVFAKTITVVIAFSATKPNSKLKIWFGPRTPICLVVFSSLIQILIGIAWLSTSPPFVEHNTKSRKDKIIIECNEGSIIMFYLMLGYLGILASISFIVAFLARKLPDSFNEAKYITFSMLAFTCVWISFVPAYLSAMGTYLVAVEIFAILSSSAGLLGCIFAPKCYIIMLRPEMNTREYLKGKL
ncbi:extracellular calcium-sensing receptor-like [Protopterus annectens]|uniref:extracellular calcium-sensing receptor-like n=1 Tax=Protopterus annectens TaxID=7888 RepID=UPI001CF9C7A8|nr:extracellular calcium-sensing receptor-like [Protopterus annectens]